MANKDKNLRIVVGVVLILIGLPGIGFVRGMMPGMMGYTTGISNITGIVALIAGIWLVIDAAKK
jgi:uncharacterized membrane protein